MASNAGSSTRVRARRVIFLLLLALALPVLADTRWTRLTEPAFEQLSQEQGLPHEIATAIAEDGDGFLWVGTAGGLARWDGYRFRVYRAEPRMPGALPASYVQVLHGDPAGRLWIGTSGAGIARFDREQERFVAYPVGGAGGLSHVHVNAIADDDAGGLWVATDGGLDHLDPATGVITHGQRIGDGAVTSLLRDRQGGLWAGTPHGLFRRGPHAQGFEFVAAGAVLALAEDSKGRIWIGTRGRGAFVIRDGAGARPVREIAAAPGAPPLAMLSVTAIAEVRTGEVWLGTTGQGIVVVDDGSGATRRIHNDPTLALSLANDYVHTIYRDRSGLVWIGSAHGLSRQDPGQSAVQTMFGRQATPGSRASTEVSWVLPMPDGRVWLATHRNGVDIVDPDKGIVGALRPNATRPASALPDDAVLALERAADGNVYIATKRGLYRAKPDGRGVARVTIDGRDAGAAVWALLADGDTLWVGGQYDGLWKLDLRTGHGGRALPAGQLTDERVFALARGAGGTIWVGTWNGLNRFEPGRGTAERIVPDPRAADGLSAGLISALHVDRHQRLWVGSYGGGTHVIDDPAQPLHFRHPAPAQGLENEVNAFVEDDDGHVWASTDGGLAMIDPQTLEAQVLRRADGVVFRTYWSGSAARTAEGELLFGGAGGLTIVRPALLQRWSWQAPVVVTDIQVGGRRTAPPPAGGGRFVVVPADANSLAVEFAAIDYSAPQRNRYTYKLVGYDADWIETDASRRLAAYTNLPPGDYKLLLRGSNREGLWSEGTVAVRVLPTWHQMLWFRIAAAAAAFVLVAGVVRWRTRLLRQRQAELERKVGERTAELEAVSQALAEKTRILERSVITDPLTGLHNRRFLTEHIDSEIASSQRRAAERLAHTRTPVDTDNVFLLIDVDHFKKVNDCHGHAAGDTVLVQFGHRVLGVLRESDHLVRWGGEEFLAVARDTDRARAEELAERIRAAVAEAPFVSADGRLLQMTCSVGFATVPFLVSDPRALGWSDIVQIADRALLAAKQAGRNAWVGIAADALARAPGLLGRILVTPQDAARAGEIVIASNRPVEAIVAALDAGLAAEVTSPGSL